MVPHELDEVDRGILHMLQEDARNNVASTIAEEVGVSPNTVRNRMERLEKAGIINGYHPQIDYERAGYQLHVVFVCTVPVSDRKRLADESLGIEGVIKVCEVLSGHRNLTIEAVGSDSDDLTAIAERLEALGIEIHDERFLKNVRTQPFNHFGADVIEDG